jgi:hypothetical protein
MCRWRRGVLQLASRANLSRAASSLYVYLPGTDRRSLGTTALSDYVWQPERNMRRKRAKLRERLFLSNVRPARKQVPAGCDLLGWLNVDNNLSGRPVGPLRTSAWPLLETVQRSLAIVSLRNSVLCPPDAVVEIAFKNLALQAGISNVSSGRML